MIVSQAAPAYSSLKHSLSKRPWRMSVRWALVFCRVRACVLCGNDRAFRGSVHRGPALRGGGRSPGLAHWLFRPPSKEGRSIALVRSGFSASSRRSSRIYDQSVTLDGSIRKPVHFGLSPRPVNWHCRRRKRFLPRVVGRVTKGPCAGLSPGSMPIRRAVPRHGRREPRNVRPPRRPSA